jgi:hypothetical protein
MSRCSFFRFMKLILKLITLASLTLALNSCGLPGALMRTAGNAVTGVANLAGQAVSGG